MTNKEIVLAKYKKAKCTLIGDCYTINTITVTDEYTARKFGVCRGLTRKKAWATAAKLIEAGGL